MKKLIFVAAVLAVGIWVAHLSGFGLQAGGFIGGAVVALVVMALLVGATYLAWRHRSKITGAARAAGGFTDRKVLAGAGAVILILTLWIWGWQPALFIAGLGLIVFAFVQMASANKKWATPLVVGFLFFLTPYSGVSNWIGANVASIDLAAQCSAEQTRGESPSTACAERDAKIAAEEATAKAAADARTKREPRVQTSRDTAFMPSGIWSNPMDITPGCTLHIGTGIGKIFEVQFRLNGRWHNPPPPPIKDVDGDAVRYRSLVRGPITKPVSETCPY